MATLEDMLLFVIFAFSIALVAIVGVVFTYRQGRKKGYQPPAASSFVLAGFAIGIAATIALNPADTGSIPLFLWRFFWIPVLISIAAMLLLILILPRRQTRRFGERHSRFPFRRVGQALIVLAVLIPLVIAWMVFVVHRAAPRSFSSSVTLGFMFALAGRYLIRRERSLHMPAMEEVLEKDQRPPVLYLRAFNQESQFFIMGTKEKYGKWAKSFHAAVSKSDQKIGLTLEEYLGNDLRRSIGPFVALGSPEDYLAPPGALRMYAKDDEWKDKFEALAQRAAAIIVEVSKSDNLRWEFEHLRSEALQEKLFVLTRPSMEGSRFAWAIWGLLWRLKGIRTMKWQEFCTNLGKLGYRVNFADPGHGAVLAFDSAAEAFALTAQANWPDEYVQPIRAWIEEHQRIGCCVASACTNCGRSFYVTTSEGYPLCADCALSTSPTKRLLIRTGLWAGALLILALPVIVIVLLALLFPNLSDRWVGWIGTAAFLLSISSLLYLKSRGSD
jgi:hypothetical protein